MQAKAFCFFIPPSVSLTNLAGRDAVVSESGT
jgi:hypothetical protein